VKIGYIPSIGIGQVSASFKINYIGIGSVSKSGIGAPLESTLYFRGHWWVEVLSMHVYVTIYRALEDKKEAFAKAEIERRKEALELRRKGQQEATLRFRNVIRKPPPTKLPEKKTITYPTKGMYRNAQPQYT